jgi:radical SAM protein (TIGR04043 family)
LNKLQLKTKASVARIKAELQEKGLKIPPELAAKLGEKYNAPAISTGRFVLCLESPAGNGELIPVFIVNGKRGDISPFELAESEPGKFEVRRDGEEYSPVIFLPRPRFYDLTTASDTPMSKVGVIVGPGHMRSVVSQNCYYQQTGQACKFCAVQYWWNAMPQKQPEQIAETIGAAYDEGAVKHVSLTTATLNTPDKGLTDLVKTAELVRERADIPVMLEFEAVSDHELVAGLLRRAKESGVTTVSVNIECCDEQLREDIMPAKGKIPVSEYIKNWEICRDIFGQNEVSTTIVAGIGESDESILKGAETAAKAGVMTFLVPHSPATGAAYEYMTPPTAERMLTLYEKVADIHRKYGLDICAATAGCVKGGGFSAVKDVARFGI